MILVAWKQRYCSLSEQLKNYMHFRPLKFMHIMQVNFLRSSLNGKALRSNFHILSVDILQISHSKLSRLKPGFHIVLGCLSRSLLNLKFCQKP